MSEYGWTERATLSKSSEVHSRQYWRTLEEQSKHTFYLFQLGGGAVGRWGMGEMGVGSTIVTYMFISTHQYNIIIRRMQRTVCAAMLKTMHFPWGCTACFLYLKPSQWEQHTREFISTQNISHKYNNKN